MEHNKLMREVSRTGVAETVIGAREQQIPWSLPEAFRTVPAHVGELSDGKALGMDARSDLDVVNQWYREKCQSNNTASAYRKAVERFLLWLASQGMVISDATRETYSRYAGFLLAPSPAWVSGKKCPRTDPAWRPFTGPLTPKTAKQNLSIIRSLVEYMRNIGWLKANPMPEVRYLIQTIKHQPSTQVSRRSFSERQMELLEQYANTQILKENWHLDGENRDPTAGTSQTVHYDVRRVNAIRRARLRVVLALGGTLGARQADLTNGFLSDFTPTNEFAGDTQWLWHIPDGKGRKSAILPVPDWIMERIKELRISIGLPALPQQGEPNCPIIMDTRYVRNDRRISANEPLPEVSRSGFYRIMQRVFDRAAELIDTGVLDGTDWDARFFREQATTHFFRHTAISRIVKNTGDLKIGQLLARHARIDTTATYQDTTLADLVEALKRQAG